MKDQNQQNRPRSRVKRNTKSMLYRFVFIVITFALISFFLTRYTNLNIFNIFKAQDPTQITSSAVSTQSLPTTTQQTLNKTPEHLASKAVAKEDSENNVNKHSGVSIEHQAPTSLQQEMSNSTDNDNTDPEKLKIPDHPYLPLLNDLNKFYTHLDQQAYMKDFQLQEPSKKHFSKLLQLLIDNPPAITRETDDYFTLLKNTAHFFRVLGKENIIVLKGILDREKDSFEDIVKSFYALTSFPEPLKSEFYLIIPEEHLYDYAGFFLNSIGGRLYLFRRDSSSRMTISYYAVLIIDAANRRGNNRLGIDLRPPINSLIEEIENGGSKLKYKTQYLDALYDLKEYYDNRG